VSEFNEYGTRILNELRLMSDPIAIKMIESESDIPSNAKRPTKDFDGCMSTCQCFALSRRSGITIAQLFDDMWCPMPAIGYGLADPPGLFIEGKTRHPRGIRHLEDAKEWVQTFPRFEVGKYAGVVSAPLVSATFEPDVALFYCNSAQMLKLLLGAEYADGKDIETVIAGHSACVYSVVPPILRNNYWVSIPCKGERGRAGTQDHEIIFSAPRHRIGELAVGIEQDSTGSIPTRFSMKAEYAMSAGYAEVAREMGMKRADGSEIEVYDDEERRRSLEHS
jgi:uncharacterized protein (DUF169 family)